MNARFIRVVVLSLCTTFSTLAQAAPYQITVLATNISDYGGLGEWSFAALFEGEQDAVLFDTGFKEDTVLHNVLHLGVDLSGVEKVVLSHFHSCLLYTSPSPRDTERSRMPSSA